jgi:hypothetical protein
VRDKRPCVLATSMSSSRCFRTQFVKVVRLPRRSQVSTRMRVRANRLGVMAVQHPPRAAWSRTGGHPFLNTCRSGAPAKRDAALAVAAVAVMVLISGGQSRPCWVSERASSADGALMTGQDAGSASGARRAAPDRVFAGLRTCPAPVPGKGRGSARGGTALIGVAGPVAAEVLEGPRDDSAVGYGSVTA